MEAMSLLGILGMCSLRDVRCKSLETGLLLCCASIGIWMHLYFARIMWWDMAGGMAIGMLMYLCAHLSGERIGKGDALLVMVCGIFLGFWGTIILLWLAFFFASVFGAAGVIFKRFGMQHELPFVPFLLLGYVFCLYLWGGSIA